MTTLEGEELASARRDSDFYQPIRLRELYPRIELKGKVSLNGRDTYPIEAPRNNRPKRWYFEIDTGLLLRTDEHESDGKLIRAEEYGDYRSVDGVKAPFTIVVTVDLRITIRLTEVKNNAVVDDGVFEKPKQ